MIDSGRVETIFRDCLFKDDEPKDNYVTAEGLTITVGFHPQRLESYRAEVKAMLDQLPDQFKDIGGGGWSFLNACVTNTDEQWTDLHQRVEQLVQLGVGLGLVIYLLDRNMWDLLPGGVPYFMVVTK